MKRLEPHRTKSRRRKSPPDSAGAKSVMRAMAEGEALEQNKAITDILRVISSSPADLEPVFETILSHAVRLCDGSSAALWQYDGTVLRFAAARRSGSKEKDGPHSAFLRNNPLPLGSYNPTPQAALEKRTVHVADVFASLKYRPLIPKDSLGTLPNAGTVLAVPLLRQDELLGVLSVWRFEKQPFSDKQIAMVEAFATQATIAIHNVRLHNETKEALERQTATADILKVISASPTDTRPVFEAITRIAARLLAPASVALHIRDGELIQLGAFCGPLSSDGGRDIGATFYPIRFDPATSISSRAMSEGRVVELTDLEAPDTPALIAAQVRALGFRSVTHVPLMREDTAIGTLAIAHPDRGYRLAPKQLELMTTFANQAVIAIENVRLFNETKEALERQTATGAILRVIAGTPADAQPVFDAIAQSALRLFGVSHVGIGLRDGDSIHRKATAGSSDPRGEFVIPLNRASTAGRAMLDKTVINIGDTEAPEAPSIARESGRVVGFRAIAAAPMLREGIAIGSVQMMRTAPGPFSDAQMDLLKTFADQAVIAIENARLFNETKEALEQQTATSEVLGVISSSPTNLAPVFDAILKSATQLCDAHMGQLNLYDGETLQTVAQRGANPEFAKYVFERGAFKPVGGFARMLSERRAVHVPDLRQGEAYRAGKTNAVKFVEVGGARTFLAVPLLKERRVIGGIAIYRPEVRPFTEKQIALVSMFANQAVIAIENVRLFNETKEALEQQTATAEILRVISGSPTDIQPVFDSILEHALRLCDASLGTVGLYDGKNYQHVAQRGGSPEYVKWLFSGPFVPNPNYTLGRMIAERQPFHIPDYRELASYREGNPRSVVTAELGGARTYLAVPLLKEGQVIGGITVRRSEVRPFTQKQIDLVSTFANQAVIAIENVRLFNETKEALERQTASAEVLRVISGTPADAQPVFDAIAQSALRVFKVSHVGINVVEGDVIKVKATGGSHDPRGEFSIPLDRNSTAGRSVLDRALIEVEDTESPEAASFTRDSGRLVGFRAIATAPMLREGTAVGSVSIMRSEPGAFSGKQLELLQTFADQAAIAIENARLFNELQTTNSSLREALEQQTATGEILKVISSSTTDVQPVFETIIRNAVQLCDGAYGMLFRYDGKMMDVGAEYNFTPEVSAMFRQHLPVPASRETPSAEAILERATVNVADIHQTSYAEAVKERARVLGWRAVLTVPMMHDDAPIGALAVTRRQPGAFSDSYVALLKTFADQAVIAIENVRLFNETKEALEQQTATGQILQVISASTTDTQPVFEAIVRSAARLFTPCNAAVVMRDGDWLHMKARAGPVAADAEALRRIYPLALDRERSLAARAIVDRTVVEVPDTEAATIPAAAREVARAARYRALTIVPMLREGAAIGAIGITHPEPGFRLGEKQLALLRTFADQAVIAIENVRLFNETKEALEQQTAISEVLRVISSSPTDVKPVLEAVCARAARICDASDARIFLAEGDSLRHAAGFGDVPVTADVIPLTRATAGGRAVLDRSPIHIEDIQGESGREYPIARGLAAQVGWRTILTVPLIREKQALGTISLRRTMVRPFSDKQIALLKTFADQAAIAIENVRLFNETEEALKHQTATAEVLKTISRSTFDLQAVLQALVDNAARLSGATRAVMHRPDADGIYAPVVTFNYETDPPLLARLREHPIRPGRDSINGRALLERRPIHVADVLNDREYGRQDLAKAGGFRTVLSVPMLRDGEVIGLISLTKGEEVDPFTDKQIELVTTFADQAVIAIENVRLFNEIQEKSAQLEVANKHKSDFLANMSHELRTPLNAIIGFSEALMERMFGELNDKQSDYLKDIHESGKHLLALINDILDLSKIEAGRMDLEVSSFHLPTALSNAMTLIRERAQRHAIELGLDVDERLGEFQADERKFKQIMLNLLSNAVKFTPDGGRVDVCAKKDTDKIEIAVKDTGIGIAPEDQAAVFEEFKQVGRDQLRKAEGTGLGLALTRRFVELHGGAIRLESTPGKGSTFTVSLPIRN